MALMTALAVGGAALSAGGQIAGGILQNKAAQEEAGQLDLQAAEMERRTKTRVERLRREKEVFKGNQTAAIAAAGVEVSGSPLLALIETERSFREEEQDIKDVSKFEIQQLLTGADRTRRAGRQAAALGAVSGFGSALGSTYQIGKSAGLFSPKMNTTQLR